MLLSMLLGLGTGLSSYTWQATAAHWLPMRWVHSWMNEWVAADVFVVKKKNKHRRILTMYYAEAWYLLFLLFLKTRGRLYNYFSKSASQIRVLSHRFRAHVSLYFAQHYSVSYARFSLAGSSPSSSCSSFCYSFTVPLSLFSSPLRHLLPSPDPTPPPLLLLLLLVWDQPEGSVHAT